MTPSTALVGVPMPWRDVLRALDLDGDPAQAAYDLMVDMVAGRGAIEAIALVAMCLGVGEPGERPSTVRVVEAARAVDKIVTDLRAEVAAFERKLGAAEGELAELRETIAAYRASARDGGPF